MFGFVLTHAKDINSVYTDRTKFRANTIKVVTSWGLDWTAQNMIRVLRGFDNVIVRTAHGDPSSGKPYPHKEQVLQEIEPWYKYRRDIYVQIGNEPNSHMTDIHGYAWHMIEAVNAVKDTYPLAQIISPPLQQYKDEEKWLAALFDITMQCDYTGVHAYEHTTFVNSPRLAYIEKNYPRTLYPDYIFCELGINVPSLGRLNEYRQVLAKYHGGVFYHKNDAKDIDPQYVL